MLGLATQPCEKMGKRAVATTNQFKHAVREPLALLPMGIGIAAFGEHISSVLVFMIVKYLGLDSNFCQQVLEKQALHGHSDQAHKS